MKRELTEKLRNKYPSIFKDLYGDYRKTCMAWGIECGDGWYDIIDKCCAKILELDPERLVHAVQIKEKFGTLRFYLNEYNDDIYKVIEEATLQSSKTCEVCGKPGHQEGGSWIITLCDECK